LKDFFFHFFNFFHYCYFFHIFEIDLTLFDDSSFHLNVKILSSHQAFHML
jgi:hypothetical protein